ncbi:glycosyltransferase [Pseudarthrobacter phenanthrenivorans]|uniref:glycosyltransferase n=1 Tax=Pseudarthrobacter phenanthrenivorans TaxID=361575 RepID=UPI00112B83D5|nr:glycosyltransferase [Pseudarthrobacter phenanthrenivorans]TPV52598.1 glycosyltransferase [Pseudarthrobacter phenanthrenivorans]
MINDSSAWTLITVTYNNIEELRTWWAGTELGGARWIVVDNASTDGGPELAEELGAEVIRLGENLGFSRANNIGLQAVRSRYVAFVNPDVRVDATSFGVLERIITESDAVVCPQLKNPDGSIQPNGRGLPFFLDKLAHRGMKLPGSSEASYLPDTSHGPTYVAWAMGAAVCCGSERIREAGGWDERYFLYYEDHAFGLDAWARGQEVIVVPNVHWVHAWKRETKGFRIQPWIREIASASRFYGRYPELLFPPSQKARNRWRGQAHKFGTRVK